MELIISNLKERLNVFGLSDVVVREASDLEGNQFILIEIAGADEEEVRELISKQGKFEAKDRTIYSHSRISTFENCPLQFKFNYVDKVKTEIEDTVEAFLVTRVHEVL